MVHTFHVVIGVQASSQKSGVMKSVSDINLLTLSVVAVTVLSVCTVVYDDINWAILTENTGMH